jgi:hypothetical protein
VLSERFWNGSSRACYYRHQFRFHVPHALNFYLEVFIKGYYNINRHFHNLRSNVEERSKFVSRHSFVTSAPRQRPWHHRSKIFSLRYYANCVSTALTVLILHNVESVCFFYSNPVY